MAQNIFDLRIHDRPKAGHYYFIDAQIWIYAFDPNTIEKQKYNQFALNFVEKSFDAQAKIIVSFGLISEVINRYLRIKEQDFLFNRYESQNIMVPKDYSFKKYYRPSTEYQNAYLVICEELRKYDACFYSIDDQFAKISASSIYNLISNKPKQYDFNDYYYEKMLDVFAEMQDSAKVWIVTNDGDFNVSNPKIIVLTLNKTILDRRTAK